LRNYRHTVHTLASMKQYDVIIIGSGIAGMNAALRFAEQNKKVLLITKRTLQQSNTRKAQGGIAGVIAEEDSVEQHVRDTLVAGCNHNKKSAVQFMVQHSTAAIQRLIDLGVPFTKEHNTIALTQEAAHSVRRIAFVDDYTGAAISQTLTRHVRQQKNITILEHAFAADLLVEKGHCFGVQIIHKNKYKNIMSGLVVLAAGGPGQLYLHTTNPPIATSDGLAMAIRAGATCKDLEFIQFHPTALHLPGKPCFLISESVRGEGGYLVHASGKRFMKNYHTDGELAPRDIVTRAIFEEQKKGPVFIDIRHKKRTYLQKRFPTIYTKLKSYGIDMASNLIPVSPAAHYSCGGVVADLQGRTNITNLLAIGEVAYTGVHGANRLASNSLLEALVFSETVTKNSCKPTKKSEQFSIEKTEKIPPEQRKKLLQIRRELRTTMWHDVGIVRTAMTLKHAQQSIKTLEQKITPLPTNNILGSEIKNMLIAAHTILTAAQKRKNSLGCHYVE